MIDLNAIRNAAKSHSPKPVGRWREYSVLLPLVERGGALYVLYELRALSLDVQPGEVSFPGGAIEAGETPAEAALRETMEELGLPAGAVEVVSELDYLVTHHGVLLRCFLGIIDDEALGRAAVNEGEVQEYFLVPLAWLLETEPAVYYNRVVSEPAADLPAGKLYPNGSYNWRQGRAAVPVYTWPDPHTGNERVIWGMTARLTMAFVDLLRSVFLR